MTPAVLLEAAVAGAAAHAAPTWSELYEGWHEFFLLSGTAAVTLAGLLFVAISLHIDALVEDSRAWLLSLARAMLLSFVLVMTLSLMMLIPFQHLRLVGAMLVVFGLVGLGLTQRLTRAGSGAVHHDHFSRDLFRRRLWMPMFGYGWLALTGVALLVTYVPEFVYWVAGAICMLLGNAAGTSWDLLVRVAKVKAADAKERAAGG